MSPTAEIAAVLFSFLFAFVITLYVEPPLLPPFFLYSDGYYPTVMASCSLTSDLAGGNGCTTCRLTHILSKGCSDKVRPCVLISTE
jgi:hypothetical protein